MTSASSPDGVRLLALVDELREQNTQLERALETRVVIEQAKGVLAERYGITITQAFAVLRQSARSSRTKIHVLATRVVTEPGTPVEIELETAGASRRR